MTHAELNEELRALVDLNQRLAERIETLARRLHRHFDAEPGGKTDYRLTMSGPRQWPSRTRDDEDDGVTEMLDQLEGLLDG
jgi:hypothetical protein